jgi:hypothetical protein
MTLAVPVSRASVAATAVIVTVAGDGATRGAE